MRDRATDRRVDFKDPSGDQAVASRAQALDQFLRQKIGDIWHEVGDALMPEAGSAQSSKAYWEFFLFAVAAAKHASSGPCFETISQIFARPRIAKLASLSSSDGSLRVTITASHPAIDDDLSIAWHPGWEGAEVYPEDSVDDAVLNQISAALSLISQASPAATALVSETSSAICLLGTKGLATGSCTSLTSKFVPGLIYFTPAPVILTSESIVHEAAHLWLSRFESARELYHDPDRKVSSPLRQDPRPLTGLMHQVWVLSNLVPYYDSLSKIDLPVVAANIEKVAKRRSAHASDLEVGLAALAENEDALTSMGRNFVSSMKQ